MLAFSSFTFGLVTAVASEAPKCDPARQRHQVNTRIYDSTGHKILAVLRGTENRVLVDYDDISPLMKQAIIAVEDRRYFEHHGVDMRAIGRALWADLRQQGVVAVIPIASVLFIIAELLRLPETIEEARRGPLLDAELKEALGGYADEIQAAREIETARERMP